MFGWFAFVCTYSKYDRYVHRFDVPFCTYCTRKNLLLPGSQYWIRVESFVGRKLCTVLDSCSILRGSGAISPKIIGVISRTVPTRNHVCIILQVLNSCRILRWAKTLYWTPVEFYVGLIITASQRRKSQHASSQPFGCFLLYIYLVLRIKHL